LRLVLSVDPFIDALDAVSASSHICHQRLTARFEARGIVTMAGAPVKLNDDPPPLLG
jgi:hypothetical protein